MQLSLFRRILGTDATIGDLYLDNVLFCYVLEDRDRKLEEGGEKVYGETAIPRGTYDVVITYSNRFKRELPLLKNVPQFEGIRIHPGNTKEDTHGCLLPGSAYVSSNLGKMGVLNSRATFNKLFTELESAYSKQEPIKITIR